MKHLFRIFLTLLMASTFIACSNDESSKTENTSSNDTNSIKAFSNEKVEYKASGGVAYNWRQLSGTTVVLIDPNTDTLSFIAPEVTKEESLVFELEIVKNKKDTTTLKQEIRVIVLPAKSTSDTDTTTGQTVTPIKETNTSTEDTNTTSETNSTNNTDTNDTNTSTTDNSSQTQGTNTNTLTINSVKSLKLSIEDDLLNIDTNTTLKLIVTYKDNISEDVTEDVEWIIGDNSVISISNNIVTSLSEGTSSLQAKFKDQVSAEIIVRVYKEKLPIIELLSPTSNVKYSYVTLEVNAIDAKQIKAINRTLITDKNKTIFIKGVKNEDKFYFYNVPLIKGDNTIELNATNDTFSTSQNIDITSDANGSVPIAMRSEKYEDIQNLQTTVETATLLDASEYLFDVEGDGIIDEISTDGNFSVNLNQEGRYKPRITIRTKDNILYSSNNFALSLDVKADNTQHDPKGAEPIDVAKEFVKALMENDRQQVETFLMDSERWTEKLYSNESRRKAMANKLSNIDNTSWEQVYHPNGAATVTATIYDDIEKQNFPIGFELTPVNMDGDRQGRFWMIQAFY
jgi:hypothetical protein